MCNSQDLDLIGTLMQELLRVKGLASHPGGPSPKVSILCPRPSSTMATLPLQLRGQSLSPEAPSLSSLPEDTCSSFQALPQCANYLTAAFLLSRAPSSVPVEVLPW